MPEEKNITDGNERNLIKLVLISTKLNGVSDEKLTLNHNLVVMCNEIG